MATAKKLTNEEQVADYLKNLDHPLKAEVLALRTIILASDAEIGEQIKWNSLAFYYTGEMKAFDPKEYKRDIVVFNLHKKEFVLLVFPTGAFIEDESGLLEGKFPDSRKVIKFADIDQVNSNSQQLQTVIKSWLQLVEKP